MDLRMNDFIVLHYRQVPVLLNTFTDLIYLKIRFYITIKNNFLRKRDVRPPMFRCFHEESLGVTATASIIMLTMGIVLFVDEACMRLLKLNRSLNDSNEASVLTWLYFNQGCQ
jgi:hypothetical protein